MAENENPDSQGEVQPAESWLVSLSREFGRTVKRGKNGIDLLIDSTASAASTTKKITKRMVGRLKRSRSLSSSEEALFQEIGSKLAECPEGDYLSLQDDVEFWSLVTRLHAIRWKAGKKEVAPETAEEPETAEPSPEPAEPDAEREEDPSTEG